MQKNNTIMRRLLCLAAGLFGALPAALAHPHLWITAQVLPERNAAGEIVALQQHWQFDPFYSGVFVTDMARLAPDKRAQYWQELQDDTLNTLHGAGFYTHPSAQFADAQDVRFYVTDDGLLALSVRLSLAQPARAVEYALYEPTFYAEIRHNPDQPHEQDGCQLTLTEATPDAALRAQAAALDRDDTPQLELGSFFAQKARWQCA